MNFEQGNVVIDIFNNKWIIFDFYKEFLCVTDFETQTVNEIIPKICATKMESPKVFWLFLKRRKKNLEGLEEYL